MGGPPLPVAGSRQLPLSAVRKCSTVSRKWLLAEPRTLSGLSLVFLLSFYA